MSHLPWRERWIYLMADALYMYMKIVSLFAVLPGEGTETIMTNFI